MGSLLTPLRTLFASAEGGGHEGPSYLGLFVYVGTIVVALFVLMAWAKPHLKTRVFKHWTAQVFEQLYLFIENMCVGIIGAHGRRYVPMMMTLWMFIFVGNVIALFMPTSATADLSWNLGMALVSVGYVQWEGMRSHYEHMRASGKDSVSSSIGGFFKHMSHFSGPRLGLALIPITVMIFVVEIISELMKNVSLPLRLFGNIHGGHMAVEAMNNVLVIGNFSVPFGFALIPIKLLTCVVQALIFTLLTCVYISLVTHHEDHDEHEHGHGHEAPAAA